MSPELFRAIRQACSTATWSRGVEWARTECVLLVRQSAAEVELRVRVPTVTVAPSVTFYLEDEDWSCDCTSGEDVCAHTAAAAIALQKATREGVALKAEGASAAPARLGYRLHEERRALALKRVLITDGQEEPLVTTLAAAEKSGKEFVLTSADAALEAALGSFTGGVIPVTLTPRLLARLAAVDDLTLEGKPVRVLDPSPGLCVRVEDCGAGVRVRLDRDPNVRAVLDNGVVVFADAVAAVGAHGLDEREYGELRAGKIFAERDVPTLVGDVLPRLESLFHVVVDAERLPRRMEARPHLEVVAVRHGVALEILVTLVYGNPPRARLDGERLTLLSGKEVPRRDPPAEARLERQLRQLLDVGLGERRAWHGEEAVRVAHRIGGAAGVDLVVTSSEISSFVEVDDLAASLRVQGETLDVEFKDGKSRRASAAAVLEAFTRGESLVPLLEGGLGRIPQGWLATYAESVRNLLQAREHGAAALASVASLTEVAALSASLNVSLPPRLESLREKLADFSRLPVAALPVDLKAELRPYQRHGVDWLAFLESAGLGALLADDMGLGKTLQALCVLTRRALVVCPTSVLANWLSEVRRFRPGLSVCVFHGGARQLDEQADLVLTTYAVLRLDVDILKGVDWSVVVLDEAQNIKNPTSQAARAAATLKARFRVALSGTPVENRLEDLWSQMHFLNPGLLGGRDDFHERYGRPIASGDAGAASKLRERVRPFILRRKKAEVAPELPPRTEVVLRCQLSPEERHVYDTVRATLAPEVERLLAGEVDTLQVLEALLRLRQAACHRALVPGFAHERAPSAKLLLLGEQLDEIVAEGHRALVFSQWTSFLDLVSLELTGRGIEHLRLDGATRDRAAVVRAFQEDGQAPVLIMSLKAGGVGLNLTAADHVFILDPWWNPAAEDQAADRAHRIGQTRPVVIHKLVTDDTIEERLLELQDKKRGLAAAAIDEAGLAAALTRDDLVALFR